MKTDKQKELLLQHLRKTPIIEVVCQQIGVGRSSYYRWRQNSKEFAKKADKALEEGILLINDLAEAQLINAIKQNNITGIIYWLNHRHKDYGNRLEIDGKISHIRKELSDEEKDLIEEALRLAMPKQITAEQNHDSAT